jgi:D-alanyl-D-alanine carboxypeptidase
MIMEQLLGRPAYAEMTARFLDPLALTGTIPSISRVLPGLAQGYAGKGNPFGGSEVMLVDGKFVFNPQFEWAGGGFATTGRDLARWAAALYGGTLVPRPLLDSALVGVPSRLGRDVRYGLGVMIWPSPLGLAVGHSGFFPGYLTEMRYWPDHRFAVAVGFTSSDGSALGMRPPAVVNALASVVADHLGQGVSPPR